MNLSQEKNQSDGEFLTPFEQAQRYGVGLPVSMHPQKIIVCNFTEFLIYDMETLPNLKKFCLKNCQKNFLRLIFSSTKQKIKFALNLNFHLKPAKLLAIFMTLCTNYLNPDSEESLQSLNKLCVRLVFCLYAESAEIFGKRKIFRDFLQNSRNIRRDLILLFEILNMPEKNRDKYLEDDLKIFPYVNGGLFADEKIEIPNFTDEIKFFLLEYASRNFDWSGISPTIFGAVFESTLNPITRRTGGMHYTSIDNIHKVIDNLFLNDLHEEFISCKKNKKKLLTFQDKILLGDFDNPIKVSINQFYGIEINDFAVAVAKTALWIAEL